MEETKNNIALGTNQILSIIILAIWVFSISFFNLSRFLSDFNIILTFIPCSIISMAFWFDFPSKAVILFLASSICFSVLTINQSYNNKIRIKKIKKAKKIRRVKRSKYIIKKIQKAINKYAYKNQMYPNPKSSGDSITTRNGENTLQAILSNIYDAGDGIKYISKLPKTMYSKNRSGNFVCVVSKKSHYLSNQSQYQNCLLNSFSKTPKLNNQGYIYYAKDGLIRYNSKN
ncbi:MAG: hypothetical protein COB02_01950 [Candidatus Cloacimonadota bacterium]|nr:MAG: hypothetical protein COB02_01950 [Candidatus Cloacimonadota bacterium]